MCSPLRLTVLVQKSMINCEWRRAVACTSFIQCIALYKMITIIPSSISVNPKAVRRASQSPLAPSSSETESLALPTT